MKTLTSDVTDAQRPILSFYARTSPHSDGYRGVADAVGLSLQNVHCHVQNLQRAGLLKVSDLIAGKRSRGVIVTITVRGRRALGLLPERNGEEPEE